MNIARYTELYRDKLLDDVIPFWLRHSPDRECGGYFACLDRKGKVYDTDKFLWPHGRQVWMLSKLYHRVRQEAEYLDVARLGAEFIRDHGFDENGHVYFALDRTGQAIEQPWNIFSDCFCAMGLAEYAAAADADWARDLAVRTYHCIQDRLAGGKDPYSRFVPGIRATESLDINMINLDISLQLDAAIDSAEGEESVFRRTGLTTAEKILDLFIDRREGLIFENVSPDGSHPDTFAGRLVIPGHAMEIAWILISAAKRWGRPDIADAAVEAIPDMLEFGWDKQYGGFFGYMDARGKPPERLDWNQKLWWVHAESLVALIMAYECTGDELYAEWFEKFHDYSWNTFGDTEYGEWFGNLNRRGEVLLDSKGDKWKGCFHLPRALWLCWQSLEKINKGGNANVQPGIE